MSLQSVARHAYPRPGLRRVLRERELPFTIERDQADEARHRLFQHERPAGRVLIIDKPAHADPPTVLSECGGLSIADPTSTTWGYSTCQSADALASAFRALLNVARSAEMFAGFCYTQFADTYQEANGLLHGDRRPKFDLEAIAMATCGSPSSARAYADCLSSAL